MMFNSTLPGGVITATLTPLHDDLSVHYEALISHCHWLLSQGSNGIALLGTTGEANSFSIPERMGLIDRVIAEGIPPEKLLIGTGCCALPDTIHLTKHAMQYKVGGILMLPPFYYKQIDETGIMRYFDHVIQGVGDDALRIYLYHFPKMSGVPFTLPVVRKLIEAFPGIIVGMKDSGGDWSNMELFCREIPGFRFYAGTEKHLLDTLLIGGVGCISATANATVHMAANVFKQWKNGDAVKLQHSLTEVRTIFDGHPFVGVLKYLFARWHGEDYWLNVRPPNSIPDHVLMMPILQELEEAGFSINP